MTIIRKELSEKLINPADSLAIYADVYNVEIDDNAVFCNLLDIDENQIADHRVLKLDALSFDLNVEEIDIIHDILIENTSIETDSQIDLEGD